MKNIQSVWAKQPSYLPLASVWQGTSVSVPAGTNWTTVNDIGSLQNRGPKLSRSSRLITLVEVCP